MVHQPPGFSPLVPRQSPSLVSSPHSACLHLPPCTASICPHFAALGLLQGPCCTLECLPVVFPFIYLVSPPLHPCVIHRLLVSSGVWYLYFRVVAFTQGQGARAPPLPGSRSPPPLLRSHSGAVQAIRPHIMSYGCIFIFIHLITISLFSFPSSLLINLMHIV